MRNAIRSLDLSPFKSLPKESRSVFELRLVQSTQDQITNVEFKFTPDYRRTFTARSPSYSDIASFDQMHNHVMQSLVELLFEPNPFASKRANVVRHLVRLLEHSADDAKPTNLQARYGFKVARYMTGDSPDTWLFISRPISAESKVAS